MTSESLHESFGIVLKPSQFQLAAAALFHEVKTGDLKYKEQQALTKLAEELIRRTQPVLSTREVVSDDDGTVTKRVEQVLEPNPSGNVVLLPGNAWALVASTLHKVAAWEDQLAVRRRIDYESLLQLDIERQRLREMSEFAEGAIAAYVESSFGDHAMLIESVHDRRQVS